MAVVKRLSISATALNVSEEFTHWFLMQLMAAQFSPRCVADECRISHEGLQ